MVFHTTNSRTILELEEKRKINSSKRALKEVMEISNYPNRQEKELISDFRDVLKLRCLYYVQLGGSPLFLFMEDPFIQGR
jgi:hypothetical protein